MDLDGFGLIVNGFWLFFNEFGLIFQEFGLIWNYPNPMYPEPPVSRTPDTYMENTQNTLIFDKYQKFSESARLAGKTLIQYLGVFPTNQNLEISIMAFVFNFFVLLIMHYTLISTLY